MLAKPCQGFLVLILKLLSHLVGCSLLIRHFLLNYFDRLSELVDFLDLIELYFNSIRTLLVEDWLSLGHRDRTLRAEPYVRVARKKVLGLHRITRTFLCG